MILLVDLSCAECDMELENNEVPEKNPQYTTVCVGNLPPEATRIDLHCYFHALGAGIIEEVHLQHDNGLGFVRYSNYSEAALAVQLENTESNFNRQIKRCIRFFGVWKTLKMGEQNFNFHNESVFPGIKVVGLILISDHLVFFILSLAQGVSSLLHLGQAQSASSTCTQGLYEQQLALSKMGSVRALMLPQAKLQIKQGSFGMGYAEARHAI